MNIESFIINLKAQDRKYKRCIESLSTLNIFPKRFDAINGKELTNEYLHDILDPQVFETIEYGRYLDKEISSVGAIGCSLSHIQLWQNLVNSNSNEYLIFEDDVIPSNICTVRLLNDFINNLPFDWDMCFLGFMHRTTGEKDIGFNIDKNKSIHKMNSITFGMHAYLINKKGAEKLLKKVFPLSCQIDSFISYMSMYYRFNAYRPSSPFFLQNNLEGSSIQDNCPSCLITRHPTNNWPLIETVLILILIFLLINGNKR